MIELGYRRRGDGGWYRSPDPDALNWHELWVLAKGFIADNRFHLSRAISPDWEWTTLPNSFLSMILHALHSANWQRGGGKGDRPKLITAQSVRGDDDDSQYTKSGVRSGRRRGRMASVSSASDLAGVKDAMKARRRKVAASRAQGA